MTFARAKWIVSSRPPKEKMVDTRRANRCGRCCRSCADQRAVPDVTHAHVHTSGHISIFHDSVFINASTKLAVKVVEAVRGNSFSVFG